MSNGISGISAAQVPRRLLAFSTQFSTRFLLEASLSTLQDTYPIEFAPGESDIIRAVDARRFDAYIIDVSVEEGDGRFRLMRDISTMKLKGITRLVLLLDRVPPAQADHMETFGPLCFIECFFTKERLLGSLNKLFEMKDTGSRVKADNKFFDVTVFSKKK